METSGKSLEAGRFSGRRNFLEGMTEYLSGVGTDREERSGAGDGGNGRIRSCCRITSLHV